MVNDSLPRAPFDFATRSAACPHIVNPAGNRHSPPSRHSRTHSCHSRTHSHHSHTHPRHSHTHPRHSREGGNPPRCVHHAPTAMLTQTHRTERIAFDKTEPTYYPRAMTTLSKPQSKETPCNPQSTICNPQSPPPAVNGNRHNATESNEAQQKLVPARASYHIHGIVDLWLIGISFPRTRE